MCKYLMERPFCAIDRIDSRPKCEFFPASKGILAFGLRRDEGQRRALRADWITRLQVGVRDSIRSITPWMPAFAGHDEEAGITYADFGNEVLSHLQFQPHPRRRRAEALLFDVVTAECPAVKLT
jgi:hypothetical protein